MSEEYGSFGREEWAAAHGSVRAPRAAASADADVAAPIEEVAYYKRSDLSSNVVTFFTITKCFIGAASFELPWAFKQAGWLGGIVGILALFAMSYFSLTRLAKCSHISKKKWK